MIWPAPRPLATRQYVWFEDAARTQPRMVSCKMKTADHIRVSVVLEALGPKSFKNVSEPIPVFRLIPPGVYEKIV